MGRKGYSSEFRQRALDLLATGRKVADVSRDLDVSDQTLYNWRRQERVDRGEREGTTTLEGAKLREAKKRIAALEAELAVHRRAAELLKESADPKVGSRPSK
jgi:transposase-like protein